MQIEFDETTHTYRADGVEVPSVTQVLSEVGINCVDHIPEEKLEAAGIRGRHIHAACHYLDDGDLDFDTVKPEYLGYIRAYENFKNESGFFPRMKEAFVFSEELRVAGTLDRLGTISADWLRGLRINEFFLRTVPPYILIDLKTGEVGAAALQTAGYALCLKWPPSEPLLRAALKLNSDGTYKFHPYVSPLDKAVFRSAVQVCNWKRGSVNGRS